MRLNNKVSLIVPTMQGTEAIEAEKVQFYVDMVLSNFAKLVGGASVIEQRGAWVSDEDGLIIENNYLVYAHCTEADLKELTSTARMLSYDIEDDLKQDRVMYEVNGEARFTR